jgi:hypothetical protein
MNEIKMDSPGRYQISIQGVLSADWSDRLGGLEIVTTSSADGRPVTTLTGDVIDQAVLLGVLNALYDLRYPLLSVRYQAQGDSVETNES